MILYQYHYLAQFPFERFRDGHSRCQDYRVAVLVQARIPVFGAPLQSQLSGLVDGILLWTVASCCIQPRQISYTTTGRYPFVLQPSLMHLNSHILASSCAVSCAVSHAHMVSCRGVECDVSCRSVAAGVISLPCDRTHDAKGRMFKDLCAGSSTLC